VTVKAPTAQPGGAYSVVVKVCDNGTTNGGADPKCTTGPDTVTVTKENAALDYTGDSIGLVGANATLRYTVWDSAAAGYSGPNPETSSGTIGDITKMWVRIWVYGGANCASLQSGWPKLIQVADTGTLGDGIGTATTTFTSNSELTYCIDAKLVNAAGTADNDWYDAGEPPAEVTMTFYQDTGEFVTGGGWIWDPGQGGNGHGNFGFNARFNKSGAPQGQMVYVWRGTYNGVASDFRIKSNSLTSLGFQCWNGSAYVTCPFGNATFPAKATLVGKSNIQIVRAKDGVLLYSDGNSTFSATVVDSGQSSGIGVDRFQLTVYDKNAVLYKQVGDLGGAAPWFNALVLQGGNVVIHGNTK
jgi:hypothetical protein